jgi:hypothetical protein
MTNELSILHLELAALSKPARSDFNFWRERLEPILRMQKGMMAALAIVAETTGVPLKTVQRKFYAAKKIGLMALVDRRLAGPEFWKTTKQICISLGDKELVKLYCGRNQRSSRTACKALRRDWRLGRVRTTTPVDSCTGFPRGWSTENLARYAPTHYELKAVRVGRAAAASERPLVYTTRKGLHVASHIMLDDMWHDFEVNSFAEHQAGRPLELFSHDLFSARKVRWGIRVRTRKDDGSHHGLTKKMTRLIIAATLYLDGYSPRGTIMTVEHGAAGVDDLVERILFECSDGLITTARSGMTGAASHAGQYPGIARGNYRFKASLESSNNLTHNVFAALPGQTGLSRDRMPEEHPAMMRHNEDLLAARTYLSPERAALLQFPILELNQFMTVAHELYRAIEDDTDHDLEGWVESGHVVNEYFGGQWRPRKMSRREVWEAGAGTLLRIPGHAVVAILGDDLAAPRKVRSNMFEFDDREVGPGVHRYESLAFTPHGEALRLRDGETYETFVNPFAPDTLFVRRGNGAYIGECRRIDKPCRGDTEAVHRACGAAAKIEAELLAPVRVRHLADAREKLVRHENNARILGNKRITMGERMQALADKEVERGLTSEDMAAATTSDLTLPTSDFVSPEEMARYFSSAATEGEN